jgi:hypothetical protein
MSIVRIGGVCYKAEYEPEIVSMLASELDVLLIQEVTNSDLIRLTELLLKHKYYFYAVTSKREQFEVLCSKMEILPERKFCLYSNSKTQRGIAIARLKYSDANNGKPAKTILIGGTQFDEPTAPLAASQLRCALKGLVKTENDVASILIGNSIIGTYTMSSEWRDATVVTNTNSTGVNLWYLASPGTTMLGNDRSFAGTAPKMVCVFSL